MHEPHRGPEGDNEPMCQGWREELKRLNPSQWGAGQESEQMVGSHGGREDWLETGLCVGLLAGRGEGLLGEKSSPCVLCASREAWRE